jgi:hypothetical protein
MAIVEKDSDGGLYVPAELLSGFGARTAFEAEAKGDSLVLRPIDRGRAFWERSTPAERVKAVRPPHSIDGLGSSNSVFKRSSLNVRGVASSSDGAKVNRLTMSACVRSGNLSR